MIKPNRKLILQAMNKKLDDVIASDLRVLFCGINPGLYSAAAGHNFARPGNRFWPAIFKSGFTDRLLDPAEEKLLLQHGCGITNIVNRATAGADELSHSELVEGAHQLARKVVRFRPRYLAVLGLTAYRVAFRSPNARIGLQKETIRQTQLWVLPNPSGLNAHYQLPELIRHFRDLRECAF